MTRQRSLAHTGATLVELLVALLVMGLLVGMAGLGFRVFEHGAPTASDRLAEARAAAIERGTPVVVWRDSATSDGGPGLVRFLPDGRAIGPGIDPLTGELPNGSGE